ncbi:hypothetical protein L7F22_062589 [Adiantum nelumboides]|nr:hypothetical protein [Adiantum nelumboides]
MAPRRLSLQETLDGIEAQFALEKKDLLAILKRFRNQMDHGLANDGQDMAMIPTFDAVGVDVVMLLQSCLDELGVKVRVNCLVNDTVGALLAHGYQSRGPALLGAIFGTGTNGAYVEQRSKIGKLEVEDPLVPKPEFMIINAEWGGFDDERNILPVTVYDNVVDREAIRPRHHAFEKMISGMYLGEVCRIVLLHLIDSLLIFQGHSSTPFTRSTHLTRHTCRPSWRTRQAAPMNTPPQERC